MITLTLISPSSESTLVHDRRILMSGCHWWCYFVPKTVNDQNAADGCSNQIFSSSAVAVVFCSWLNRSRRRYLLLILCSPFLFPLFCALCPLLFMAEICFLICRRRQKAAAEKGGVDPRLCVEDGDEAGLLHRYLEDQMLLVIGSGYKLCGGEDDLGNVLGEDGVDEKYFDCSRDAM